MMGEAAETVGLPAAAAADGRESVPPAEVPPAVPDPAAAVAGIKYGHIRLDISNSVLPLARLSATPSAKDGLPDNVEEQTRSLGCELIQLAGKLLKLPQVAMATGCVLFQRFYYAKSLVRIPFDIVAMSCVGLASKIEEAPRRFRDIISVFTHIRQVRGARPIQPVILDQNYIALKNQIIKAERRVLKELGFCVHVKHPHKVVVVYLTWLELINHKELLQLSWNFMNDSLRTDVFVRYTPETIACACIYLSARKLRISLPKNPSWFEVLSVEEEDIKDCCFRIISLYSKKKENMDEIETIIEGLRKRLDESRKQQMRDSKLSQGAPGSDNASPAPSRGTSPNTAGAAAAGSANGSAQKNPVHPHHVSSGSGGHYINTSGTQMNALTFGMPPSSAANSGAAENGRDRDSRRVGRPGHHRRDYHQHHPHQHHQPHHHYHHHYHHHENSDVNNTDDVMRKSKDFRRGGDGDFEPPLEDEEENMEDAGSGHHRKKKRRKRSRSSGSGERRKDRKKHHRRDKGVNEEDVDAEARSPKAGSPSHSPSSRKSSRRHHHHHHHHHHRGEGYSSGGGRPVPRSNEKDHGHRYTQGGHHHQQRDKDKYSRDPSDHYDRPRRSYDSSSMASGEPARGGCMAADDNPYYDDRDRDRSSSSYRRDKDYYYRR